MNIALIFFSQFVVVALLVIQSANNVHGRNALAAVTSVGIGIAQLVAFRLLPDASFAEMAAFVIAGPFANVFAQYVKRKDIAKIRRLHGPDT